MYALVVACIIDIRMIFRAQSYHLPRYTPAGHYIYKMPSGESRPTGTISTVEPVESNWPSNATQTSCGVKVRPLGGRKWVSQWAKFELLSDGHEVLVYLLCTLSCRVFAVIKRHVLS